MLLARRRSLLDYLEGKAEKQKRSRISFGFHLSYWPIKRMPEEGRRWHQRSSWIWRGPPCQRGRWRRPAGPAGREPSTPTSSPPGGWTPDCKGEGELSMRDRRNILGESRQSHSGVVTMENHCMPDSSAILETTKNLGTMKRDPAFTVVSSTRSPLIPTTCALPLPLVI